jgi:acyl-CoA reductase-like NAD-dependent aldehyde dehydrogenase
MASQTKVAAKGWGIFVDGKWLNEGETSEIRSPYDHSVVGEVHLGATSHTEAAVRAAQRAFETTKKSPGYERKRILNAISEGIRARHEEFSQVMCLEAGKPIKTARVEVDRAIFTSAVAAEEATRIGGEWLPLDWQSSTAGRAGIVRRFPVGPILAITPFNFPLNLVAHKVAPAIAAGCTIILKPAPQTPLSSLLPAEVVASSGLTAGAFNVLPLANDVAEKLVSDDRLKMKAQRDAPRSGLVKQLRAARKLKLAASERARWLSQPS